MRGVLLMGFVSLAACRGAVDFSRPIEIELGESTIDLMQTADFDGDGDVDVVVRDSNSESLRFFLNQGDGSMVEGERLILDDSFRLVVGDINGDGAADLVLFMISEFVESEIRINNGDGTFGAPTLFPDEFESEDPAAESFTFQSLFGQPSLADFDNDGDLDLAMLNLVSTLSFTEPFEEEHLELAILQNNGDGSLQAPLPSVALEEGRILHPGDFNGDGSLDVIVTTSSGDNTTSLLINNGSGIFEESALIPVEQLPGSISADVFTSLELLVASGDFDGDGDLDLALNNARTTFDEEDAETNIGLVTLLENLGGGVFAPSQDLFVAELGVGSPRQVLLSQDITGDGVVDLIAHDSERSFLVFQKQGEQIIQSEFGLPRGNRLASEPGQLLGDINGDALPDLLGVGFKNRTQSLLIWRAR